jgi:hypothetical protein
LPKAEFNQFIDKSSIHPIHMVTHKNHVWFRGPYPQIIKLKASHGMAHGFYIYIYIYKSVADPGFKRWRGQIEKIII